MASPKLDIGLHGPAEQQIPVVRVGLQVEDLGRLNQQALDFGRCLPAAGGRQVLDGVLLGCPPASWRNSSTYSSMLARSFHLAKDVSGVYKGGRSC